jgi:short-subunit dehydrogenase
MVGGSRRKKAKHLRGKVVLITGSSRGLGLALAEEFARKGARVVLNARDQDELQRAREALINSGAVHAPAEVLLVPADLRKAEEAEYLIHRVSETWSGVDILVNNASIITVGPVENQTSQDFHNVMDTNFFAGLHCTMAVLPQMLSRGKGTIVNITSIGGKVPIPHLLPYTASKFAAVGFSQGLHVELKRKGIYVLTVCPGLMRTGSHVNGLFSGRAEEEYRWFSLGATTPGVAVSAQHAARKIVRAMLNGETEMAITPQAIVAARLGQVCPEATAMVMGVMDRMLPDASVERTAPKRGMEVRDLELMPASLLGWLAARRYNELS